MTAHLHEIEAGQFLRDSVVLCRHVISLDFWVFDVSLFERCSVDANNDDFAVCAFIQNRQTIMQSAIYSELLHSTVWVLTTAYQLNITVRCQLFKFALCAFSLDHHRNVPSGLVLQQKLDIRVVRARAAGFGVGVFKSLGDGVVDLFIFAVMPYSIVIQERLKVLLDFFFNAFRHYFSTSSRCS